jgi:hypothetical protein
VNGQTPEPLWRRSTLSLWLSSKAITKAAELRVLGVLWLDYGDPSKRSSLADPSVATIAEACGVGLSTARRALEGLVAAGAIERTAPANGRPVVWRLLECPHEPGEGARTQRGADENGGTSPLRGGEVPAEICETSGIPGSPLRGGEVPANLAPTGGRPLAPTGGRGRVSSESKLGNLREVSRLAGHASLSPMTPPHPDAPDFAPDPVPQSANADRGARSDVEGAQVFQLTHPEPDEPEVSPEFVAAVCDLMRRAQDWAAPAGGPKPKGPNPQSKGTIRLITACTKRERATLADWAHVVSAQAISLASQPSKLRYLSFATLCRPGNWDRCRSQPLSPRQLEPWRRSEVGLYSEGPPAF